jgi:hypothetical protein
VNEKKEVDAVELLRVVSRELIIVAASSHR